MSKLTFLKSKVFWTAVVIVAINSFPQVKQYIPAAYVDMVSGLLGLAATYFHVSDVNTAVAASNANALPETPNQTQV